MTRVIIHIGAGKTGSTAIQYFLSHNAARLGALGKVYPRLPGASSRADVTDHNQLAYGLLEPRPTRAERAAAKALAHLAGNGDTVLLSGEIFYMRPFRSGLATSEAYLAEKIAAIDRLMALLAPFDRVDAICYVRRHDRWLESIYNQRTKTGRADGVSFAEFAAGFGRDHYRPQLDAWAAKLCGGRLTVRPFEAAARGKGGLIADFLRAIGVDADLPTPAQTRRSINPRLGRDHLEFGRLAQRLPLGRRERALLWSGLIRLSAEEAVANPEPTSWSQFMDLAQRQALLQSYDEDDAEVAKKYLSPDFECLFDSPTAEQSGPYPGLTVERAFTIADALLSYMKARDNRFAGRLRRLARLVYPG